MDDRGLAAERTALAWQRTALATTAGAAVMARFTVGSLGVPALVLLVCAVGLSVGILVASRTRYGRRVRQVGQVGHAGRSRSGLAPLALSTAVALLLLVELAALGDQVVRAFGEEWAR